MPIYEHTYSSWSGEFLDKPKPWWVLTKTTISLLFKKWIIVFLFFASIPFLVRIGQIIIMNYNIDQMVNGNISKHLEVNSKFFKNFLNGQYFVFLLMTVFTGAGIIAKDRQLGALPLYFSKPLSFYDYLTGRGLVIAFYTALVTIVPAVLLFVAQVLIGADSQFLSHYFWVPFSLLGIWIFSILIYGGFILALSSLFNGMAAAILFFGSIGFTEMIRVIFSRIPVVGLFSIGAIHKQISAWMLGLELPYDFSIWSAMIAFSVFVGLCFLVLRTRIRPTEVVK